MGKGSAELKGKSTVKTAVEDPGGKMAADPPLDVLVSQALGQLDRHQLPEAEALFRRALHTMAETERAEDQQQLLVKSLVGLAEVYFKRSRSVRDNLLDWSLMVIQATSLQQEANVYCERLLDQVDDQATELVDQPWLNNMKEKTSNQIKLLNECLVESFENQVQLVAAKEAKARLLKNDVDEVAVDMSWLNDLEKYMHVKIQESTDQKCNLLPQPVSLVEMVKQKEQAKSKQKEKKVKPKPEKKIDCDRVQRAIMRLVKQVSSEMRSRFVRQNLTEETLRRSVSSEMMAKFAPIKDSRDILGLFENAVVSQEFRLPPEEFGLYGNRMIAAIMDGKAIEAGDEADKPPSADSVDSEEQSNSSQETIYLSYGAETKNTGAILWMDTVKDGSCASLSPEDEAYELPGVLTIWRSYNSSNPCLPHRPYRLQSFEELSPLTEVTLSTANASSVVPGAVDTTGQNGSVDSREDSVLGEHKLKQTLAAMLTKWAEKLQADGKLSEACSMFKYALGLLPVSHSAGAKQTHNTNNNLLAQILRNIGSIKCTQGDLHAGMQLMEEALGLHQRHKEGEDNAKVAQAWYDMGNAYMAAHWQETSIFEHVMLSVKEDVENEMCQNAEGLDDAVSDSDCSDHEDSYSVCTYEAIGCYKNALAILSKLRKDSEDETRLYVDVLTMLADCSILIGDYDRAVLCYEEALYLCQNTLGSASLTNSAHILSMLGTANFFLGTYAKAITMYETAHILQQHLYGAEENNFEMAFTLTMVAVTFYVSKHYHKCVSWCLKAFELYTNIFQVKIVSVTPLNRWFVAQTLYTLGYAYSTLNFNDKALHYLELCKNVILKAGDAKNIKQLVKTLKCIADVQANMENNETALEFYNEALELSMSMGHEKSAIALQNQLLNRMAGVYVSNKEYATAAKHLEQAMGYQRNVQKNIKGDLMDMLQRLAVTYTLAGDLDKAIECYTEVYDSYNEARASPGPETAKALGDLATLYHVKACIQEDDNMAETYFSLAEECYQDAVGLDPQSIVCLQYANYQYQQGQNADALLTLLPFIFSRRLYNNREIVFHGPEQAVVPEHLQHDTDDIDEVSLDAKAFTRYLSILCYKQLDLWKDAEDALVIMCRATHCSSDAFSQSMLGYSLLELGLHLEAAECFYLAACGHHEPGLAITNMWLSLGLWAYTALSKALYNVWEYLTESYIDLTPSSIHTTASTYSSPQIPHDESLSTQRYLTNGSNASYAQTRDSGYFDYQDSSTPAAGSVPTSPVKEASVSSSLLYAKSLLKKYSHLSAGGPPSTVAHGRYPPRGLTRPTSLDLDDQNHGSSWRDTMDETRRWNEGSSAVEEESNGGYTSRDRLGNGSHQESEADQADSEWTTVEETVETSLAELEAIMMAQQENLKLAREQQLASNAASPEWKRKTSSGSERYELNGYGQREDTGQMPRTSPKDNAHFNNHHTENNNGPETTPQTTDRNQNKPESSPELPSSVPHPENYDPTYFDEYRMYRDYGRAPSTIYEESEDDNKSMITSPDVDGDDAETETETETEMDEDAWETWETTETVETPPEILKAILASQGRL